ncbi:MAG: ATP-dependent dethiobiotin synthetase BioD [Oscillatoria sp. SIO1A7]|nr:ATP-dependent dethiobiotin synthetase BioD [Oscillatoria sp. SIO1A7]
MNGQKSIINNSSALDSSALDSSALLIAGTDTDAGKTALTTALAAYLFKVYPRLKVGIMKPIQSGMGDRDLYLRLFDLDQSPEETTPLYFQAPLAPPVAAAKEGLDIDLGKAWQGLSALARRKSFILIEALGGLGSPITPELTVADLARDWRIPTVLVVPVKLGAIGQAVANVALARQAGVRLKGIVLNCLRPTSETEIAELAPRDLIESLTNVPICGILPHFSDTADLDAIAAAVSDLDLEIIMPIGCRV